MEIYRYGTSLTNKEHIQDPKMTVATWNNLLKILANGKKNENTIRTTALALCYSVAEYASTVWLRSKPVHLLDPKLSQECRAITGCMNNTNHNIRPYKHDINTIEIGVCVHILYSFLGNEQHCTTVENDWDGEVDCPEVKGPCCLILVEEVATAIKG